MSCNDIQQRLNNLKDEERELKSGMALTTYPKTLEIMQANLDELEEQIAEEEKNLADCKAIENPPPPRPFTVRVKDIFCSEASKEVGVDEPYLLIVSVDRRRLVQVEIDPLPAGVIPPVEIPAVHCFKVGPWSGVKPSTRHSASKLTSADNPKFWNLSGLAKEVASPEDVIFVVGVFENDGSSPEAIRLALEAAMEVTLALNLDLEYSALCDTLVSDMKGTFDTVRLLGLGTSGLNADDQIGVRHLSLTPVDLDTINALGKHEKTQTFTLTNTSGKITNQYTVTFTFEV